MQHPDIKSLTVSEPGLVDQLAPAFEKYNEEQFATVKLPGSSQPVGYCQTFLQCGLEPKLRCPGRH